MAPVFDHPGILVGRTPKEDITFKPWVWMPDQNDEKQKALQNVHRNSADRVSINVQIEPAAFMRMLAKIAHAGATAEHGLSLTKSLLPKYILGQDNHLDEVVGSWPENPISGHAELSQLDQQGWLVEFGVWNRGDKRFMTAKIELFRYLYIRGEAADRLPAYWIVIAEADQPLVNSVLGSPSRAMS
jgi:hypothetical protein